MTDRSLDLSVWNLGVPLALLAACGPVVPIDETSSETEDETIGSSTLGSTIGSTTTDPIDCQTDDDCGGYGWDCVEGQCIYTYDECNEGGCCYDECCYDGCWYPECYSDSDCGSGYICEFDYCVPAPGPVECEGQQLAKSIPFFEGEGVVLSLAFIEASPAPGRELVVANESGVSVVASDGGGAGVAAVVAVDIAAADIDGDGDEDVVLIDATGVIPMLRSYLADGVGGFTEASAIETTAARIALGDIDADGLADLVSDADGGLAYHRATGGGVFDVAVPFYGGPITAMRVAPPSTTSNADVLFHDGQRLWFATGAAGLVGASFSADFSISSSYGLAVGDYDGDGHVDASAIDDSELPPLIRTFRDVPALPETSVEWTPDGVYDYAASGDLDGDGRDDLVLAAAGGELVLRLGGEDSDGGPLGCYLYGGLGGGVGDIEVDDFDGDGRAEVITVDDALLWRTSLQ